LEMVFLVRFCTLVSIELLERSVRIPQSVATSPAPRLCAAEVGEPELPSRAACSHWLFRVGKYQRAKRAVLHRSLCIPPPHNAGDPGNLVERRVRRLAQIR
jgi:hypothetical protein